MERVSPVSLLDLRQQLCRLELFHFSSSDFENNQSQDRDGNYSLVVRIEDNTSIPQDLYLDFIIQDVNEPPFSTGVGVNQTAPENQTHAATLSAVDPKA